MPQPQRRRLERAFGEPLGAVRVHADADADVLARQFAADAFTHGRHLFFRAGQFAPQTETGFRLLAHEAAHAVQQGEPDATGGVVLTDPASDVEHEARRAAERAADGARSRLTRNQTRQVARQPSPGSIVPREGAPDGRALLAKSQPHLLTALSASQIDALQKWFNARKRLRGLHQDFTALADSILSEDVRRRERLGRQINAEIDASGGGRRLAVPMEKLLGPEVLPKAADLADTRRLPPEEILWREKLYRELTAHPAILTLREGDAPEPVYDIQWGPGGWAMANAGGRIDLTHLLSIQKINLEYQRVLLGRQIELTEDMLRLRRAMGGTLLNLTGKKLGEIHGTVWNTSVVIGTEVGPISGFWDDTAGRADLFRALYQTPSGRVVVKAPDGLLHLYATQEPLKHVSLTSPEEDSEVKLLSTGSQAGNVWLIVTADGVTLEATSGGWRAPKDPNALTRVEKFAIGAIFGDWFEDAGVEGTVGQIIIGVIPIVGQVADARDVAAGIYKMYQSGGKDGKLQTALALVGLVPLFGDAVKALRGAGKRAVREAVDKAAGETQQALARRLMKDANGVAEHFGVPKALREPMTEELSGGLKGAEDLLSKASDLKLDEAAQRAARKEAEAAAAKFAETAAQRLDELGGNVPAFVQFSGGSWKSLARTLSAGGPKGLEVGTKMEAWRAAQVKAIEADIKAGASDLTDVVSGGRIADPPAVVRTGTAPNFRSDLDINLSGPDAALFRHFAEARLAQRLGPDWRRLMDAEILVDPRRIQMFTELEAKAAQKIEKKLVSESELNVLARMVRDGKTAEAEKLARELGVPWKKVPARADEIARIATDADYRLALDLRMDQMHRRFLAETDPAAKAVLAEEMATLQSKINTANDAAYATPGAVSRHVTRREPMGPGTPFTPLSPAMNYMAVLDDLAMLHHASSGGLADNVKSMSKYAQRLMVAAGQNGADAAGSRAAHTMFENISKALELARRDPTGLSGRPQIAELVSSAFARLDGQLHELVKATRKTAQGDMDRKTLERIIGAFHRQREAAAVIASIILRKLDQKSQGDEQPGVSRGGVPPFLHFRLRVSQPGEPTEEEADRVAGHVMRTPEPVSAAPCPHCAAGGRACPTCLAVAHVQRKAHAGGAGAAASESPLRHLGAGQPLDRATRSFFEPRFGVDLAHVRVHADRTAHQSAHAFGARAYTAGRDVVFAGGEYAPQTPDGQRLLAHELAHVVQQDGHAIGAGGRIQRQPEPRDTSGGAASAPGTSTTGPSASWRRLDTMPRINVQMPSAPAFAQLKATLRRHPHIGSLPVPTKDELHLVQEANGYFESTPLEWWETAKDVGGEYLQKRNRLTEMFERKAYHLTLYILEQSEAQAGREQFRYAETPGGENPEARQLQEAAAHLGQIQQALLAMANNPIQQEMTHSETRAHVETLDDYIDKPALPPPNEGCAAGTRASDPLAGTEQDAYSDAICNFPKLSQRYRTLREIYGQRFPILLSKNQDYSTLAQAAPGALSTYAYARGAEVNRSIDRMLKELQPSKIWSLPVIVQQTKTLLGIEEGTGANDAIQGKLADIAWDKLFHNLAMAALQIGLEVVAAALSGGTSLVVRVVRVGAAAAGAYVGTTQATEAWDEHSFQKAAAGEISLDPAQRLSADEPGYFWLALAVVGAVIDVGAAAMAFRALLKPLKAADDLGDTTKAVRALAAGDPAAAGAAKAASTLDELEEVVRVQARVLKQEGKLAEGLTEDLFVARVMSGLRRQAATDAAIAEHQAGVLAKVIDGSHPRYQALVNNDRDALLTLLTEHGEWKSLVTGLERSGHEQIARNLVRQRQRVIDDLAADLKTAGKDGDAVEVGPMKGGSEEAVSDIDLQIGGPHAGEMLIRAEAVMAQRFGASWSELFRLNIYTEGGRLTRYQETLSALKPGQQAALTGRITAQTERLTFARMLQHAGDDPVALARVDSMARRMGIDVETLRPLASIDDAARTAQRNRLLREVDQLEAEYRTARGARRTELAEQITSKQMEANFYTHEANIGPGSLAYSGVRGLKKQEAYQAALTQLEMIEHVIARAGGDVALAGREYELFKYVARFADVATQAGVDTRALGYLRSHAKTVAGTHRELMEETAHLFQDPGKVRKAGITDVPQQKGALPPVTDEFLEQQFSMFLREADRMLPRLNRNAPRRASVAAARAPAGVARRVGEYRTTFVDAWGETHEIRWLGDGRIIRCSKECLELVQHVRRQSARLRRWLDPTSATRAEASALTDQAKDVATRAKGVPDGSPEEAPLISEAKAIGQSMSEVEKRALTEVQTGAFESITRLKNPPKDGDLHRALEAEPSLKNDLAFEAKRLDDEWAKSKSLLDGELDDEMRRAVGDDFAQLNERAKLLEQRAIDRIAARAAGAAQDIDYALEARKLGYETRFGPQQVRGVFNSHGQEVFFDGNYYITRDIGSNILEGSHKGGVWKKFDRRGNRLGTYNKDLSVRLGD